MNLKDITLAFRKEVLKFLSDANYSSKKELDKVLFDLKVQRYVYTAKDFSDSPETIRNYFEKELNKIFDFYFEEKFF